MHHGTRLGDLEAQVQDLQKQFELFASSSSEAEPGPCSNANIDYDELVRGVVAENGFDSIDDDLSALALSVASMGEGDTQLGAPGISPNEDISFLGGEGCVFGECFGKRCC